MIALETSPLQLRGLYLESVSIQKNEQLDQSGKLTDLSLGYELGIQFAEEVDNVVKIVMSVTLGNPEDGLSPYLGKISVSGVFENDINNEAELELLKYNGTAQVFSYLRAELNDISLKFGYTPVVLPSMNLTPLVEATFDSIK